MRGHPSPRDPGARKRAGSLRTVGPLLAGYLALVVLVLGFGGWSVTSRISGAIIAPGRLEVAQNRQVVEHLQGGVVRQVLVHEGTIVTAGEVLIRLDARAKKSELQAIEGQYFELQARRARLEAERDDKRTIDFDAALRRAAQGHPEMQGLIDGQVRLFAARRASLAKEAAQMAGQQQQIKAEIRGLEAQYVAQKKQHALVLDELSTKKKLLAKGLVPASQVSALAREAARLEGVMGLEVTHKFSRACIFLLIERT